MQESYVKFCYANRRKQLLLIKGSDFEGKFAFNDWGKAIGNISHGNNGIPPISLALFINLYKAKKKRNEASVKPHFFNLMAAPFLLTRVVHYLNFLWTFLTINRVFRVPINVSNIQKIKHNRIANSVLCSPFYCCYVVISVDHLLL